MLCQNGHANNNVEHLTKNRSNWAVWGGNYGGTRYSELGDINTDNINKLQLTWSFSTGVLGGHEGGPLVVDDVIYIHTPFPNIVYALDQKTRSIIWTYKPNQDKSTTLPVICCDTVNRGLAYAEGKIFLQQADTTLVALDASTRLKDRNGDGKITASDRVIWTIKNGDPKRGETNTQAPMVMKDKVIAGISGGEFGVRGFIAAYDINDGHLVWKGYSMGSDKEMLIDPKNSKSWTNGKMRPLGKNSSLKSWVGEQWKVGGGTTWGWLSYDAELNLMYYGSGNPGVWNPVQRAGDNKWSASIWARDIDTGKVKWIYQMTPHDEWSFDGTNEMVLVDQKIHGRLRKLLVHFDHNGFSYTLDRVTGELLVAEKFNQSVNWASHINMQTGKPQVLNQYSTEFSGEDETTKNICPSVAGSKNQQPVAYSPKSQLFYIPGTNVCMDYEPFKVAYTKGKPYVGATVNLYRPGSNVNTGMDYMEHDSRKYHLGFLSAWDATQGKTIWSKSELFPVWSGVLATAGGLVFYGTLEGYLKAVNAKTGKELYRFKTPSGIIGNVNTWRYQGKQYVGVLSGIGGLALMFAEGLPDESESDCPALGPCGAPSYRRLKSYSNLGGVFSVFALPGTQ